jgi:SWI/SNF-related matrix-associated actin-dependent regulator 1 of chromatin subfamily A
MILKPYQRTGVGFLASKRGAILGDEMGLGKTAQAICAMVQAGVTRALVICPASLKLNWRDEVGTWAPGRTVGIADTKTWPDADVVIVNYDILEKLKDRLFEKPWPLVGADEAHYIKNPKAKRSKMVLKIPTARRWLLTGTPMLNRPRELWTLLRLVDPKEWPSYKKFVFRYCDPKWIVKNGAREFSIDGSSNEEELAARLAPYMLRRLKADVLQELPDKIRQTILLAPGSRTVKDAIKMERELAQKQARGGAVLGEIAKVRQEIGKAKVPAAVEHVYSVLEQEEKILIFAHHRSVVAKLAGELEEFGVVTVTGDTPKTKRHENVLAFQNDPKVRVFIGNLQAAGVGLTLTAARVALFVEQDWGPKIMEQAEDRVHRIGQSRNVLIQYLCFDGSLDAVMARTAARKEEVIRAIIKPTTEGATDMSIESILERIAAALEKQTEQYDALLRQDYIAKPAEKKTAETPAVETAKPAGTFAAGDWDPKKEKVLGRYDAAKRAALEAEAKRLGLPVDPKMTGAQIHEAILRAVTEPTMEVVVEEAPADDFGGFDEPAATEPEKTYTPEEMRAKLIAFCRAKGFKDPTPANELIAQLFPGKGKFGELTPADYPKLAAELDLALAI